MLEVKNGKVKLSKDFKNKISDRRDAPEVYDMNDAINVWLYKSLIKDSGIMEEGKLGIYIMPRLRSIDIDEEIDFIIAEAIIRGRSA